MHSSTPKIIVAAADYGFERKREDLTSDLERALICEAINWSRLPHELDELVVEDLTHPLYLSKVYHTYKKCSKDMDSLSLEELEMYETIQSLRSAIGVN